MYCPKCGQQQASEEVFFCSRCGLKLDVVRAFVAGEHDGAFKTTSRPTHRDVNSGVGLMLLGTLFTSGVVALGDLDFPGAFLVLTASFIAILLTSRHLMRAIYRLVSAEEPLSGDTPAGRKGRSFGAFLMYVGTVLSVFAATMVPARWGTPSFFITVLTVFVLLLLFSTRLMRAVQDLVPGKEKPSADLPPGVATAPLSRLGVAEQVALPSARYTPVPSFGAQRVSTAEIVAPPSVTERTTNLLGDKKAGGD